MRHSLLLPHRREISPRFLRAHKHANTQRRRLRFVWKSSLCVWRRERAREKHTCWVYGVSRGSVFPRSLEGLCREKKGSFTVWKGCHDTKMKSLNEETCTWWSQSLTLHLVKFLPYFCKSISVHPPSVIFQKPFRGSVSVSSEIYNKAKPSECLSPWVEVLYRLGRTSRSWAVTGPPWPRVPARTPSCEFHFKTNTAVTGLL